MLLLADALTPAAGFLLVLAIGLALSFEFVNGFHDTANAVATVIYTHSLKPSVAVVWSGCWNLIGVLVSSGAVAFSILGLLPVELVLNVGSAAGFAMVFSLLISAIIWNVGTWYLGLPASSSHTLIGSIMGVGLANSWFSGAKEIGEGVNWGKAHEVFMSLMISPLVGFALAGLVLLVAKTLIRNPNLYSEPAKDAPPPGWIRGLLVLTCTGVSFAHGSNDGQKGMGLVLLILIGLLPGVYAVNLNLDSAQLRKLEATAHRMESQFQAHAHEAGVSGSETVEVLSRYLKPRGEWSDQVYAALAAMSSDIARGLNGRESLAELPTDDRRVLRTDIYLVGETIGKLNKEHHLTDPAESSALLEYKHELDGATKFIPVWVKCAVALALGLGTMIGWKRIVVTVGEKIGKEHLTYAQGASAELVAMGTILAADHYGLPVSTTHVLSSGIAGTMAANRSGLQMNTLRNILLAWVLTLPVCVVLGAGIFSGSLYLLFHVLGFK